MEYRRFLPKLVAETLAGTASARNAYMYDYLPHPDFSIKCKPPLDYDKNVRRVVAKKNQSSNKLEQHIQCYALAAFQFIEKIWPKVEKLLEYDEQRGTPPQFDSALIPQDIIIELNPENELIKPGSRDDGKKRKLAGRPFPWPKTERDVEIYPSDSNEVKSLAKRIKTLLPKSVQLKNSYNHDNGIRLHSPSLVRYSMNRDSRIFCRNHIKKHIPKKASIVFLLDLSASMVHCINTAMQALVLLIDALGEVNRARKGRELEIAVRGFQHEAFTILDYSYKLTESGLKELSNAALEVHGTNPSPNARNNPSLNDDGLALMDTYHMLRSRVHKGEKLIIFIGDGIPYADDGETASQERLRNAIRDITLDSKIKLIGLGIGGKTAGIKDYFGEFGQAEISPDQFPKVIESLLSSVFQKS